MSDRQIQRVQLIDQALDVIATIELDGDHLTVDTWGLTTVDVHHASHRMPNDWHRGYQEALRDIAMKLDEAGPVGVAEWIRSNAAAPPGPAQARSHVLPPDADALLDGARQWARRPF